MDNLSNMEIIVRSLDRLVQRSLSEIFIEGVVTDNNRDEFMIQALGILVSHWTRWDAGKIMVVS